MSVKKFKFVSPGVFIDEIDQSQIESAPARMGPVIIGRTTRGPAMKPITVQSFSEFVEIFGEPEAGLGGTDIWRNGQSLAPTYASYAAQAYLKNNNPVTIVRLLGYAHTNYTADQGEAGWETANSTATTTSGSNGGAYGLFIIDSGSATSNLTGTLAAVWYLETGSIRLSGTTGESFGNAAAVSAARAATWVQTQGADKEFKLQIDTGGANGTVTNFVDHSFNFNINSDKFIRKVFNTNPTLTNSTVTKGTAKTYWLGETYEDYVNATVTGSSAGQQFGVILALQSGSANKGIVQKDAEEARTGWFFSQDLTNDTASYNPQNMQKLFRLVCLSPGTWDQNNVKVSISDIKPSPNQDVDAYGTFTLSIRRMSDTDKRPRNIERYTQCNLNPNSINYVGRKIGTKYTTWDDTEQRLREFGDWPNVSKRVRVEVNGDVADGKINAECLPFGVYGPPRFKGFTSIGSGSQVTVNDQTGSTTALLLGSEHATSASAQTFVVGHDDIPNVGGYGVSEGASQYGFISGTWGDNRNVTASFVFPTIPLRSNSADLDLGDETKTFFGVDLSIHGSSPNANKTRYARSVQDIVRTLPSSITDSTSCVESSWYFTLDDVSGSTTGSSPAKAWYISGSYHDGTSKNAAGGGYQNIIDAGFDQFTTVFHGGSQGVNIKEADPFNNTTTKAASNELSSYAYYTIKRAIDTISNPEDVEYNLAAMPGIYNESLTSRLLDTCEDRADALAIIDLDTGYQTAAESSSDPENRLGSVSTAVTNIKARKLNNSYGCCYYPWVQIRDSLNNALVWVPPSVVALGVMGSAEANSAAWFAPAGFTRGGLSEGAAGLPVVQTREKLKSSERDKLYENNINPIATFPAEGVVIFGQKTLQASLSALDRINVRRLMVLVKKEISRIASRLLFAQNTRTTWARFRGQVEPFLANIKANQGLENYKIVLDETTTTPDLVDRNIMYAKIFLKPAKAIEFIAIDFVITNDGAAFED